MAHRKIVKSFQKKPDFKISFAGYEAIQPELLDTFPYEYIGKRNEVVFSTDEFTAVCPWSGLPDFAKITVRYVPYRKILELRSVKYYLQSFRQVGIFQEHLTVRILNDLVKACDPHEMTVKTEYNIRGGIRTTSEAGHQRKRKK